MVVEYARSTALLVAAERPAASHRGGDARRAGSGVVTWWLFAPGLTARQRVCRLQFLRRNSIGEVGATPLSTPSDPVDELLLDRMDAFTREGSGYLSAVTTVWF